MPYLDLHWTPEWRDDVRRWVIAGRDPRGLLAVELPVKLCAHRIAPRDVAVVTAVALNDTDAAVGDLIAGTHPIPDAPTTPDTDNGPAAHNVRTLPTRPTEHPMTDVPPPAADHATPVRAAIQAALGAVQLLDPEHRVGVTAEPNGGLTFHMMADVPAAAALAGRLGLAADQPRVAEVSSGRHFDWSGTWAGVPIRVVAITTAA